MSLNPRGTAKLLSRLRTNLISWPFRRHMSQKPSKPPPKPQSIPGPSWAWVEPLAAPFRAYGRMQSRSPYMTQLSSSLTIYFLGDLSAQLMADALRKSERDRAIVAGLEVDKEPDYIYAPERGLRAMAIGGISSIPSYHWFLFLGRRFNYSSHWLSIAVKIVVNQSVFTPIFNSYFFGMHSLLSGNGWAETKRRVLETVPVSWRTSWKFWPIVTAFSFTFVPPQYRSVTAGVVAIFWQTYLSWLNGLSARHGVEQGTGVPERSERKRKEKARNAKEKENL